MHFPSRTLLLGLLCLSSHPLYAYDLPPTVTDNEINNYYYQDEAEKPKDNIIPDGNLPHVWLPLLSRLYVEGVASNGSTITDDIFFGNQFVGPSGRNNTWIGYADGDLMIPIYGNPNSILYYDNTFKYAGQNNGLLFSNGGGWRHLWHDKLCGVYMFADYDKTVFHNNYWVFNPGIEGMTNNWDANLNVYLPISNKEKPIKSGFLTSDQLGLTGLHSVLLTDHSLLVRLFNENEVIGNGIDGEIGYTIHGMHRFRPFLGGYAYDIKNGKNIMGVQGGFDYPVMPYISLGLQDSYDKVHRNTISFSLRLTLGGVAKYEPPVVQDRMLDPIPRHLGTLNTGSGIPSEAVVASSNKFSVTDNVWFFDPAGTPFILSNGFNNCTYTHPCNPLTQATINGINSLASNAKFFFDPNTYNNPAVGTGFTLFPGQNFYGRMNYFKQPAVGASRAVLNDTLFLPGRNLIQDLQVVGNTVVNTAVTGVVVPPAAVGLIKFTNAVISASSIGLPGIGAVGLDVQSGNAVVNIDPTVINALVSNTAGGATGILDSGPAGGGSISVNNSTVNVGANGTSSATVGINDPALPLFLTGATVNVGAANAIGEVDGILASANSGGSLNINTSTLNVGGTSVNGNINGINDPALVLNLNGSTVNVAATNPVGGNLNGILAATNLGGVLNVNTTTFNLNANGLVGNIYGINDPALLLSLTGSTISVLNTNNAGPGTPQAGGILTQNAAATITNSTVNVNSTNKDLEEYGVNQGSASVNITGSTFNVAGTGISLVDGIQMSPTGPLSISNSAINANGQNLVGLRNVVGINGAPGSATLNVNNSTVNVTIGGNGNFTSGMDLDSTSAANISQTFITVTSGSSQSQVLGLFNEGSGLVTLSNSAIAMNLNSTDASAGTIGVTNASGCPINVNGSTIAINMSGASTHSDVAGVINLGLNTGPINLTNSNIVMKLPNVTTIGAIMGYENLNNSHPTITQSTITINGSNSHGNLSNDGIYGLYNNTGAGIVDLNGVIISATNSINNSSAMSSNGGDVNYTNSTISASTTAPGVATVGTGTTYHDMGGNSCSPGACP